MSLKFWQLSDDLHWIQNIENKGYFSIKIILYHISVYILPRKPYKQTRVRILVGNSKLSEVLLMEVIAIYTH